VEIVFDFGQAVFEVLLEPAVGHRIRGRHCDILSMSEARQDSGLPGLPFY
jgi:hypothetical protein